MIKVTIRPDPDTLTALQDAIDTAPQAVRTFANRSILPRYRARIVRELSKYPPKPKYPLRWQSARQRRAFFASNGFGKGIPYQRTGNLGKSWQVSSKALGEGMSITTENTAPYAQYVVGSFQQTFHADTGWVKADPALAKIQDAMTEEIIDLYFQVLEAKPGTRFA